MFNWKIFNFGQAMLRNIIKQYIRDPPCWTDLLEVLRFVNRLRVSDTISIIKIESRALLEKKNVASKHRVLIEMDVKLHSHNCWEGNIARTWNMNWNMYTMWSTHPMYGLGIRSKHSLVCPKRFSSVLFWQNMERTLWQCLRWFCTVLS